MRRGQKGGSAALLPLTVPEVRRLLLALAEPPDHQRHRWAWSRFRRRHQAVAAQCHAVRRGQPSRPSADPPVHTMPAALPVLTNAHWPRVALVLPPDAPTGRPAGDHRRVLAGILWVMRTGAGWNQLPAAYGSSATAYRRYHRWRKDGTWSAIVNILLTPAPPPTT